MTVPLADVLPSAQFGETERVIQSHPLIGASVPRFGNPELWDLNGVVRRPANQPASGWKIVFSGTLVDPSWNLLARELSIIQLNPRHPVLIQSGLSLSPRPANPSSVIVRLSHLRRLARWANINQLTAQLDGWADSDVRRFVASLRQGTTTEFAGLGGTDERPIGDSALVGYLSTLSLLHRYRPALSGGGLVTDPRGGQSARRAIGMAKPSAVSTPAIRPEIWFPLVRAAWTYVHTFGSDILRAQDRYATLLGASRKSSAGIQPRLESWLANSGNRIPIHVGSDTNNPRNFQPHWSALTVLLGVHPRLAVNLFSADHTGGARRREMVLRAISSGHPTTAGFIDDLAQVTRADGTIGNWHPGLYADALKRERVRLRDACFVLVAALSMMRDSEIHEITKGSLIEHYGYAAVVSTKQKHDPNLPVKAWWITEPVAEAIAVAEQLSLHADRIFTAALSNERYETLHGDQSIDSFIAHVNATRGWTGLEEIPDGSARPHMFRRTMAMLTDQFAGSEIALGIQLKHVATRALANRSTQGYAASDTAWAAHLDSAIDAARFRRLEDLYQVHKAGDLIGYGPAAEHMSEVFEHIQQTVQARGGDATVEHALLRKERISIRFGTLNHCAFDEKNPAGAICLDNATVPPGHPGPLQDRCRPDRCTNSIIGPEHVPIWNAEKHTLLTLIATPGLPAARAAALKRELVDVEAVLRKADKEHP